VTDGAATQEPGSAGTGQGASEGRTTPFSAQRPVLTVVRGEPTAEQLAALLAVVSARGGGGVEPEQTSAPSLWNRPALRRPLTPGPGAWRAGALPQ
jgi:hypothetical protein